MSIINHLKFYHKFSDSSREICVLPQNPAKLRGLSEAQRCWRHKIVVGDGALDIPEHWMMTYYMSIIFCFGTSGRRPLHHSCLYCL